MTQWVLHVDLDQFVAAVEILRRPELRGLPVVVGGDGDPTARRAVVSTASYEAREHGVHSGLPLRTAARRCPEAVFLPVDAPAYEAASAQVMATLRTFEAVVEVWGWDEAFLAAESDDPESLAHEIQTRIRADTHLECTVGIGENKLQAKLAAGFGKPAGVFRLTFSNWFELLGDRPVDALWGIGGKTSKRLAALDITTVHDLAATDPATLVQPFGPTIGPHLVHLARGEDDSTVTDAPYIPRSRGRETTFPTDLTDWTDVRREVARLARELAADVATENRITQRVAVKVRFVPFNTYTRQYKLPEPTTDPAEIERAALVALDRFDRRRPVRLLGVRTEFVMADPPLPHAH